MAEDIFQSRSDKAKLEIGRRSKSSGILSMTQISPEVFPQEAKGKPLCGCRVLICQEQRDRHSVKRLLFSQLALMNWGPLNSETGEMCKSLLKNKRSDFNPSCQQSIMASGYIVLLLA